MKNEDKIVELLTESIKRQDRQEAVQDKMLEALVNIQVHVKEMRGDIREMRDDIGQLQRDVREMRGEIGELASLMKGELTARVERLEEAVFKKGA